MSAPDKLLNLIDRFDANLAAYKQGQYNETQARREFIDQLVYALYGLTEEEIRVVEEK